MPEHNDRYARHFAIKGWDESVQKKLTSAHVFIAGAGGLGSPVIYYLAAAGIEKLTVCDYDVISITNLNRQILYSENELGKSKVFTAAKRINELNSNTIVKCIEEPLSESLTELVITADLIVDCLDNFKGRFILNRISQATGKPLLHAGVSEYYGQLTFIQPGETPCLECFVHSDAENKNPGIIGAAAGMLGSMQALEAIKYLSGTGTNLKNRILFIDGKTMEFTTINITKNPSCPRCGFKESTK